MEIINKGIVKNGFVSGLQTIVTTLAYFIIIKQTGKEQLGLWISLASFPAALTQFGSGVSGCLLRYIPIYIAEKDYSGVKGIILSGVLFNTFLASLICCIGYLFGHNLLNYMFKLEGHIPVYYLQVYYATLVYFFINFVGSVFLSALDGLQLIYKKNMILISTSCLFCILALVMIRLNGITGLVYAQVAQGILVASLSLIVLWRARVFHYQAKLYHWPHQKLFLTYGQGMQAISFAILFFEPVTILFLNRYFNLTLVGIYGIASRVILQARTFVVSSIQVIMPMISGREKESTLNLTSLTGKATRGGSLLSFSGFCAIIVLAVTVIVYTHHQKDFRYFVVFLSLLSVSYFINIISSIPYSILMALGKLKPVVISHILSTCINILLFLLLGLTNRPHPLLLLLPPSLAISLSSAYLLYLFYSDNKGIVFTIPGEDRLIYCISIVAVILSFAIYRWNGTLYPLLAFNSIYAGLMIYLMFKNSFLGSIRERLFLKSS